MPKNWIRSTVAYLGMAINADLLNVFLVANSLWEHSVKLLHKNLCLCLNSSELYNENLNDDDGAQDSRVETTP